MSLGPKLMNLVSTLLSLRYKLIRLALNELRLSLRRGD
jgi:hypothetical protein